MESAGRAHLRARHDAPADRPFLALQQVVQDLKAEDVEKLVAEEDAWLLAFCQGAPPDPRPASGHLSRRASALVEGEQTQDLLP